ncbi:MAG: glycosyltransferase family 4 protein [Chitinophagaceae bacterium]
MKKKVLIDATPVTSLVDGLSNYIVNLIKYLPPESFGEFEYTILINKGLQRDDLTSIITSGNFQVLEKHIAPIGPKRDWDMFCFFLKYRKRFDVVHITSNNYPFILNKGIITIHDITFKRFFDNPKYTFNLATAYMNKVIGNSLKKTCAIIAISKSTKNELIKWYNLDEKYSEKIKVIYEGWEHVIPTDPYKNVLPEYIKATKGNFIFYLGTLRIHKNIAGLLEAFLLTLDHIPSDKKLAISGSGKNIKKNDLKIFNKINKNGERVFFTGYLPGSSVEEYFTNADCYILPSLSEGFGLPILEAFYFQTPVLCSNTTSLTEVAGQAAIYFDPYNPRDIAKAIIEFYNDPLLSKKLIEEGNEQLKKFSWKKTAQETVEVYRNSVK